MSRPRPPLHDPYGLLRPPPPLETPTSLYSATPNALSSTVSLPLPVGSPGRRTRQRGVSPSRTQHGEEYDDQPYLTSAVRHHGQVTLVPPVNQGRTRKVKRKRNVEAAASTSSLAETVAARPSNPAGPSRANNQSRLNESPRRPRQGLEARTISSPEFHSSSYPDYPPPSFEEVLALDRRNSSTTPVPVPQPTSSPQSRLQAPTAPPGPSRNATPWEQDRLQGLSLEERVQREFERSLKHGDTIPSRLDSGARSTSPTLAPGTPTSVAASNFLTPQNLTPSTPRVSLPESESPRAGISQTPSPPPVPPKSPGSLHNSPLSYDGAALPQEPTPPLAPTEAQVPEAADERTLSSPSTEPLSHAPSSSKLATQASPSGSETPLDSLLFTARLRLDESPDMSSINKPQIGRLSSGEGHPQGIVGNNPRLEERRTWNSPQKPSLPLEPTTARVTDSSPERRPERVYEELTQPSGSRGRSPSRTVVTPHPPARSISPVKPSEPIIHRLAPTSRRPPPPPPPPRRVGAGVAARISAYEALLAKAPKVAPPLPPRPRPCSQASTSTIHSLDTPITGPGEPKTPTPAATSLSVREPSERSPGDGPHLSTIAHTTTSPSASRPLGSLAQDVRPLGAQLQDPDTRISLEPESQVNHSRPLPTPPIPGPSRRVPSPERTQIVAIQPQALVPARIGPDGKLEIIPDAGVIWLDKDAPKPDASALIRGRVHLEGTPRAPLEGTSSPSNQESFNPFEDSFSGLATSPSTRAQPTSPIQSPSPVPAPNVLWPEQRASSPARLADDFEYTDLDLLVSRLEENEAAQQGANYEQLLAVGEVLGPAHPPMSRPELDLNVGLVEIQRRRVMKDGRVKLKLSLMGVGVDKCGICLTQFKASSILYSYALAHIAAEQRERGPAHLST